MGKDKRYYKINLQDDGGFMEILSGVPDSYDVICDSDSYEEAINYDPGCGVTSVEEISKRDAIDCAESSEYCNLLSEEETTSKCNYHEEFLTDDPLGTKTNSKYDDDYEDYDDEYYIPMDDDEIDYEYFDDIIEILNHIDSYYGSADDYVKKSAEEGANFTPQEICKISKHIFNDYTIKQLIKNACPKFKRSDYENLAGEFKYLANEGNLV